MYLIKATILVGTLIAVTMCLFPPYSGQAVSPRKTLYLPNSYHYILEPPQGDRFNSGYSEFVISYELDSGKLYGQLALVGLFTAAIAFSIRARIQHLEAEKKQIATR